jgi:phosphoadenosine phosphosulfate reductase
MTNVLALEKLLTDQDIVSKLKTLSLHFENKIVFSSSFGLEDQVISHLIFSHDLPIRVFSLDTGRLFAESYDVWEDTRRKYKKKIEAYFPNNQAVEKLIEEKGLYSFYQNVENRKECCHIRKVEPLERALKGADCWITGIRAEQSANRQTMTQLEWDETHQLVKFHPLLQWSLQEVEQYIKDNNIPYNKLHNQGYPSIGCQPCTRAVEEGEDMRAGRWWWEQAGGKECGLHEVKK